MAQNSGLQPPEPNEAVRWLMDLAERGMNGDRSAEKAVRLIGELLDQAGGAEAMCKVQGIAHDLEIEAGNGHGRAGHIGAFWEHIPTWARL